MVIIPDLKIHSVGEATAIAGILQSFTAISVNAVKTQTIFFLIIIIFCFELMFFNNFPLDYWGFSSKRDLSSASRWHQPTATVPAFAPVRFGGGCGKVSFERPWNVLTEDFLEEVIPASSKPAQ